MLSQAAGLSLLFAFDDFVILLVWYCGLCHFL